MIYFRAASCLLQGRGRASCALRLFARANAMRREQARRLGVLDSRYRVLDNFWTGGIGHIATIDYVIKLGILEGRSRDETILYFPHYVSIPNRFLLEQWRPHARIIDHANDLPFSESAAIALRFDYLAPSLPDGTTCYFWTLAADTYRRWQAQGRKPLLALAADVQDRARRVLERLGMPDDAWFVALHVREPGSKAYQAGYNAALNANVADFVPAISEITRRGGWVIRMGDQSMVALPQMCNVIDYCHSGLRTDWMDVFVASQCRFFLGTSSGPAYVPPAYGVSCVLTNWWPPAHRPWHAGDIFIPKMCRHTNGRRLTLNEMLKGPVAWSYSSGYLAEKHQIIVEDSASDDILTAVTEMLDRLDGSDRTVGEKRKLHAHVDRIFEAHSASGMAQISSSFLAKYQNELFE
jgi:putative glycosyltransferase (TIGR04372 family)